MVVSGSLYSSVQASYQRNFSGVNLLGKVQLGPSTPKHGFISHQSTFFLWNMLATGWCSSIWISSTGILLNSQS